MERKKYKVLDLFSGIAGFSLGFKRFEVDGESPFEVIGYVEIDPNATNTLISAMVMDKFAPEEAQERVINGDITLCETKEKLYGLCKPGEVDIIIGGPPCQSFSTIGPRAGDKEKQERFRNDERDSLFHHYIEIVEHYQPDYFVFENVTGLLSKRDSEGKKYIDVIIERFKSLEPSYTVKLAGMDQEHLVLNSADYGVPQQRNRVFIIGNKHGRLNPVPEPTHRSPDLPEDGRLPWVTVRDAISDLPEVRPLITPTPLTKAVTRVVSEDRRKEVAELNIGREPGADPTDYHWGEFDKQFQTANPKRRAFLEFVMPRDRSNAQLVGHKARGQQQSDIEIFQRLGEGMSSKDLIRSDDPKHKELLTMIKYKMDSFMDKYKKLAWDKPSGTVFAHLQKDGNRFIHPESAQGRTITVREAARLQSFPDDYPIEAIGNLRYKYIGNAVPPLLGRAIAKAIYEQLEGK